MTAPHRRADETFLPQDRERSLGRADRHFVPLSQTFRRRHTPRQLATLDLIADDPGELRIQRSRRVVIKAHVITLKNPCVHVRVLMSL
jgi:hypothetical protein